MQKFCRSQSSPVLLSFFHVSARPDQEKALHWNSGIITDVLGVNLATALCFSWLQSSVQQVRADRMRCTLVFGFHSRGSYWRRSNISSNLSLSSVFLYTSILLIEMQKRLYRFFFSSYFKKINFIEIHFKSCKGKSLGYARLLRCTLQCARSTWSSAYMLPTPSNFILKLWTGARLRLCTCLALI